MTTASSSLYRVYARLHKHKHNTNPHIHTHSLSNIHTHIQNRDDQARNVSEHLIQTTYFGGVALPDSGVTVPLSDSHVPYNYTPPPILHILTHPLPPISSLPLPFHSSSQSPFLPLRNICFLRTLDLIVKCSVIY